MLAIKELWQIDVHFGDSQFVEFRKHKLIMQISSNFERERERESNLMVDYYKRALKSRKFRENIKYTHRERERTHFSLIRMVSAFLYNKC